MSEGLSHYDVTGKARMVDVSGKAETKRTAKAHAFVAMKAAVLEALPRNARRGTRWRWLESPAFWLQKRPRS